MSGNKAVLEFLEKIAEEQRHQNDIQRQRLEHIQDRLSHIDVVQGKHQVSLEEHMRRTELAEEAITILRTELSPLKSHVAAWAGAGKALAVLASIAAIVAALLKLIAGTG